MVVEGLVQSGGDSLFQGEHRATIQT